MEVNQGATEEPSLEEQLKSALGAGGDEQPAAESKAAETEKDIKAGTAESPEPEAKADEKPKAGRPKGAKRKPKLYVFINSAPTKGNSIGKQLDLIEILSPLMAKVAEQEKVAHWNLVEFAQGKSILSAMLDKLWVEEPPSGYMLVNDQMPEVKAVLTVLHGYATMVVQGTR